MSGNGDGGNGENTAISRELITGMLQWEATTGATGNEKKMND